MPADKTNDLLDGRRQAMGTIGSLGLLTLFGCGGGTGNATPSAATTTAGATSSTATTTSTVAGTTTTTAAAGGNCALIPTEIVGPYPLLAMLSNSAMVRQDIRESKTGVPLTLTFTLENVNQNCAPIVNAAVYIWHCDKDGAYSGYNTDVNGNHLGETFLRGIQLTGSDGKVSFSTIYPGWYSGRITHIHLQVYLNDNLSVTATATTQLAFPADATAAVYGTALYTQGQNTSVPSVSADGSFSDGASLQTIAVTGNAVAGYAGTLTIGIAA